MAGGDTYTIIYLKMQLLALKTDGVLTWTGLEDNFADELALDLDEKPEDVEVTLLYLLKTGLAETQDNRSFFFPYVIENTGSEDASAQRVREFRKRQALQCNSEVTQVKRECNVEKEIELEKEIDTRDREKEKEKRKRFIAPTIEEVSSYCKERRSGIDAQHFVDYYTANGWKVGKNPMKDWKAAVRTWERNGNGKSQFNNRQDDGHISPFTPNELRHAPYDLSDMVEWPPGSNQYRPSREVPKDGG